MTRETLSYDAADGGALASAATLSGLVGQLFEPSWRRRSLVLAGWASALVVHAVLATWFARGSVEHESERVVPPVDVEFVSPKEPEPPPPSPEPEPEAPKNEATAAPASAPAPPAAARAGALHLAKSEAAPAAQNDEAVDFTTDPNGTTYGGGVVAVGGTAAFGAAGARPTPFAGTAAKAPPATKPAGEALVPLGDLSRKPALPGSDPCHGFFPASAQDDAGDVAVLVTVSASGRVTNTQLLSESPSRQGFGAAARTCLASQRFVPALDRAGNAAATAVRVNLRFSR